MGTLHSSRRQRQSKTVPHRETDKEIQILRTEPTLKDKTEVQKCQDIMTEKFLAVNLENMDPAEIIRHLSKLGYKAVQEA